MKKNANKLIPREFKFLLTCIILLSSIILPMKASNGNNVNAESVEGRWDIVIEMNGKQLPSWLEVEHSGIRTLVGRFVYAGGSARPIAVINVKDGKYSFSIPPQWEDSSRNLDFEFEMTGDQLKGTMVYTDGKYS